MVLCRFPQILGTLQRGVSHSELSAGNRAGPTYQYGPTGSVDREFVHIVGKRERERMEASERERESEHANTLLHLRHKASADIYQSMCRVSIKPREPDVFLRG